MVFRRPEVERRDAAVVKVCLHAEFPLSVCTARHVRRPKAFPLPAEHASLAVLAAEIQTPYCVPNDRANSTDFEARPQAATAREACGLYSFGLPLFCLAFVIGEIEQTLHQFDLTDLPPKVGQSLASRARRQEQDATAASTAGSKSKRLTQNHGKILDRRISSPRSRLNPKTIQRLLPTQFH